MAKQAAVHRFPPHPTWVKSLLDAWEMLDKEKGAKTAVLKSARVSKSTRDRMKNDLDKVGHDSLEALRKAINARLKTEIPPPVVPMQSPRHYAWTQLGGSLDDAGQLEVLVEWAELGRRLLFLGRLPTMMDAVRETVEAAEAEQRSKQKLSAALRTVPEPTSDRPGKPAHHGERPRR